jgi:WD40 repeat protein
MPSKFLKLVDDCERFILRFFDVITQSVMHIYHSALPWSPMSSLTRQLYQREMTTEVKLVNGINARWDSCIRTIPVHNWVYRIVFSHKGSALAVIADNSTKIFETATGVVTFEIDDSPFSAAFSTCDDMLVCGFDDGMLRVWDVQTNNLVKSFEGSRGEIDSVAFSPCGNMIVSGSDDKTVRIWDISLGHCKCVLEGHSDRVRAVCWSGTGDQVISGSLDGLVRIWNVSRQICVMIFHGHTHGVTSVASLRDSLIASGYVDGTVKLYDARSGDVLQTISTDGEIKSIQFSTHGDKLLYTNSYSATIWDLSRKEKMSTIDHDGPVSAFSPDGTRVASRSCSSNVKIWNTGNEYSNLETVSLHSSRIHAVTFAPDGQLMTSKSFNDDKIWDTTSGDCLFTFDFDTDSIVFSPNSAFLACFSRGFCSDYDMAPMPSNVQVWNVHTRSRVTAVCFDDEMDFNIIALSPCGGRLVSLSSSYMILWDLGSGKRLAVLNVDFPILRTAQITFAVDGTSISTRGDDEITLHWRISPAPLSNHHDHNSNSDEFISLPLVFLLIQDRSSHEVVPASAPRQFFRYEGDEPEWILDENGKRILWLPLDRRILASDSHGKKIAVGTESGKVYIADFLDALR